MQNNSFNLVSLLVLIGFLFAGLATIYFFSWREERRLKRQLDNHKYPSATRKRLKKVDNLLKMDKPESFFNN